jgi:hypothetical protein
LQGRPLRNGTKRNIFWITLFKHFSDPVLPETIPKNNLTKKAPVFEKSGQVLFLANLKVLAGIDIRLNDQLERVNYRVLYLIPNA